MYPRDFSSRPSAAAVIPFPSPEITPPVTKMYFFIMPSLSFPAPRGCLKNFQKIKKIRFFRPESDEEPRSRFIATFSKIPYIRANIFLK